MFRRWKTSAMLQAFKAFWMIRWAQDQLPRMSSTIVGSRCATSGHCFLFCAPLRCFTTFCSHFRVRLVNLRPNVKYISVAPEKKQGNPLHFECGSNKTAMFCIFTSHGLTAEERKSSRGSVDHSREIHGNSRWVTVGRDLGFGASGGCPTRAAFPPFQQPQLHRTVSD
jgi:hypothetical protein